MSETILPQDDDWIDRLFDVPELNESDPDTALLPNMAHIPFEELIFKADGKVRSIQEMFTVLKDSYEYENLAMDPSACFGLCANLETIIADSLGNREGDIIHYQRENAGIAMINNRKVKFRIWLDSTSIHTDNGVLSVPFGRITASDKNHLLNIDRFYSNRFIEGYQMLLLRKNPKDEMRIDSALVMDFIEGYDPYNNISIFGNVDNFPEFRDPYYLRKTCYSMIGYGANGDLPVPEFI